MRTLRPSTLSRTLALIPPAVALLAPYANAASNIYMKFESIAGEATDDKHGAWIILSSFGFGVANPPLVGVPGGTSGKSHATEFAFHKVLDKSSPELFLGCAQGTSYKTVILEAVNPATGNTYYRITLNNVAINSLNTSVNATDSKPSEDVTVSFDKIKIEYFYQDLKGGLITVPAVDWDFVGKQ